MFRKSTRLKHTHIGVIIKQVSLIYRVKPKAGVIELVAFIDNRQNPKNSVLDYKLHAIIFLALLSNNQLIQ